MLFSIVVLSYNRPAQVERILKNLVGVGAGDFNVVIKDDVSPRLPEIKDVVESYRPRLDIELVLHVNESNLGYDRNLMDSFNIVNSHYVFLLSDDDYIDGAVIPQLVDLLKKKEFSFYLTPYTVDGVVNRSFHSDYNVNRFADFIYNSILFSGLIFDREKVLLLEKDELFLSACIYSQVYLASVLVFQEGGFGFCPKHLLILGGDGENFFGKNQSAENSDLLADRSKITSDLDYQGFLLRVVDEIASKTNRKVKKLFRREYIKRLISYGLKVRALGLKPYFIFFKHYLSSSFQRSVIPTLSFFLIAFIPGFLSEKIYKVGVSFLRKAG